MAAFVLFVLAATAIGIIGLIKDWGPVEYSNGMFIGGAVAVALAILSSFGSWGNRADFKQMYSQSAGDMSLAERSKLWVHDMTRGYNALVLLSLVGVLLIGLSVLIGSSLE